MSRSTPSKSTSSSTRKAESSSRSKHHDKLSDSESNSDSYSDSDWSTSGSDSYSDSDWSDEEKGTLSPPSSKHSSSSHTTSSSKKKSSSYSSNSNRASTSSSASSYSKKSSKSFGSKLRQSLKLSCKLLCMPLLLLWGWSTSFAKQQLLSRFPTVFKRGQSLFLQLRARFWPIDIRKLMAFWVGKLLFVALIYWLLRDDSLPTPYGRTKPGLGVLVSKKEALELARGVDSKLDLPFGGHVAFKPPTTTAHARTHAHANGKPVNAAAHVDAANLAAQQRSLTLLSGSAEVSWSPPKSSLYSHMFCIGGKGKMGTQQERSCRFQNLCYRFHDRAWRYFVDPSEKDTPIILQHGKMYTAFPASFLSLGSRSAVPILVDPDAKRKRREAESNAAVAELKTRKQEAYAFGQARAPDAIGFHRPGFPGAQVAAAATQDLVIRYDAGPWFTASKVMSSSIPSEWFVPRWSKMKQHSAAVAASGGNKGEILYASISADGPSPSLGAGAGAPFEKAQPDLYIYFAPTDPLSPSRMFARDIIPLYHLMRSFDMEHRSVQLLTPYDCEQLYAAPQYDEELNLILEGVYTDEELAAQQLCELVSNSLVFPGFTTRPPLVLSNLQKHKQKLMENLGWMPTTSVQHLMKGIGGNAAGGSSSSDSAHGASAHATAEALAKGQHICFSDILMGIGVWNGEAVNSYQNVRQNIPAFREFREFYLHNLALHEAKLSTSPSGTSSSAAASTVGSFTAAKRAAAAAAPKVLTHHRITILSHPGPNSSPHYPLVNNYDELKSHLSTVYSTQHSRVEIELLDLHALGWREAVKRVQRTTILICYGSEDDALALFLPKASAVILLDYTPVERATNHTKLGNQPRAVPHQLAMQRISQMEASERGAPVTEPPPLKPEELSIAASSGVDPRQQMQQRQPAPVGSQMLAHLGLFRTFHYTLSPIEIIETPEDALSGIPKLHVKVNLQKMSVLIDAAKLHVETFIHQ